MIKERDSASSESTVEFDKPKKLSKKSVRELFSLDELLYYGIAVLIFISLGVLLKRYVLNWIVGPGFIVLWIWLVPLLVEKWRARRS